MYSNTFDPLMRLFFKGKRIRDFQQFAFESYDEYIEDLYNILNDPVNNIIMMKNDPNNSVTQQLRIKFIKLQFQQFPVQDDQVLTPQFCTLNNLTYQSSFLFDDIELQYIEISKEDPNKVEIKKFPNVIDKQNSKERKFFSVPVLVGSKYCSSHYFEKILDDDNPGQQFIIKGKQKIVVPFERLSSNELITYKKGEQFQCSINSKSFVDRFTNINKLRLFIRECKQKIKQQDQYFDICVEMQQLKQNNNLQKNMSVFVLFYAFGITNDKQILDICSFKDNNIYDLVKQALLNFKEFYLPHMIDQVLKKSQKEKKQFEQRNVKQENLQQISQQFLEQEKSDKLGQKTIKQILLENVLPHVFINQEGIVDLKNRCEYLGYMVYSLLATSLGYQQEQNRDSYMYKRCISIGQLMFQLTEDIYKKKLKDMRNQLKNIDITEQTVKGAISQLVNQFLFSNDISTKIQKAIATGKWSKKYEGVSQTYKIGSLFSLYTQNRKISNRPAMGQSSIKTDTRHVDGFTLGYIANEESPEGENIGIVFTFAMTASFTREYQNFIPQLFKILEANKDYYNLIGYDPQYSNFTKVFIQGLLKYIVINPFRFIQKFKELRNKGEIPVEISFHINENLNQIMIFVDKGRYIRPVIQCIQDKDDKSVPSVTQQDLKDILDGKYKNFDHFVMKNPGKIHYLELRESQTALIAENTDYLQQKIFIQENTIPLQIIKTRYKNNMKTKKNIQSIKQKEVEIPENLFEQLQYDYDYIEMHPSVISGASSGCIYFFSHNPGQRNVFGPAHKKRVIQDQIQDNQYVFSKKVYYLINGDRQVIRTLQSDYLKLSKYSSGHMINVMLSLAGGFDQEDSIVLSRSAAKQLYLQSFEDIYEAEISKQSSSTDQKFMKIPKEHRNNKTYNYDKINEQGLINPGTIVYKGDVIIGKVDIIIQSSKNQQLYQDQSIAFQGQEGIVLQSILTTGKDAVQRITIKIKTFVFPQIGDKVTVFSGGCKATISKIQDDDRMPYFSDGTQPQAIMNLHSLITRKSLGILFEGLVNQLAIWSLNIVESTPFQTGNELFKKAQQELKKNGINDLYLLQRYDPYLCEYTGKVFKATLYFHFLDQKPKDKIYSVDHQQVSKNLFTRHPVSGKQKKGALKLMGDLEKSAILAQNASFVTNEMMLQHCDGDTIPICTQCYNIAELSIIDKQLRGKKKYYCQYCETSIVQEVQLSYANMQLQRILRAMGIDLRFIPQKTLLQQLQENQKIMRMNRN